MLLSLLQQTVRTMILLPNGMENWIYPSTAWIVFVLYLIQDRTDHISAYWPLVCARQWDGIQAIFIIILM